MVDRFNPITILGASLLSFFAQVAVGVTMLGQLTFDLLRFARAPHRGPGARFRPTSTNVGYKALGITALVGFLIGIVLSYLSATPRCAPSAPARSSSTSWAWPWIRELGPVLAAILIAGRSGSAITAQIGVMRVTEELDAMRVMGIAHGFRLIVPRVIALAVAMPLLVAWTDLDGAAWRHDRRPVPTRHQLRLLPAPAARGGAGGQPLARAGQGVVLGMLIALTACHFGLRIRPNTQSLGEGTTASVVTSRSPMVIIADAIFAILFGRRGPMNHLRPIPPPPAARRSSRCATWSSATATTWCTTTSTLDVYRGEVLSIVGASGHGQDRAAAPDRRAGAAHLGDHQGLRREPAGLKPARSAGAAQPLGSPVPARALFSALSVIDNIALPMRELRALPDNLICQASLLKLQLVGLSAKDADKMPADLSGGMIKRVALARALALEPELVFLDEPTAGLDPMASDDYVALIRELRRELGLTVVMITHDLDTLVALSDRVAVLADRKVLAAAPIPELVKVDHPFIREYSPRATAPSARCRPCRPRAGPRPRAPPSGDT